MKTCAMCKLSKALDQFTLRAGKPHPYCRACRAERTRLHKYRSLKPGQYEDLFQRQKGRCALCRRKPKNNRLAVDHCHRTDRVRGLLCISCNRVVGFMDDPKWLARALRYLS